MKSIDFPEANVALAKDQPEYNTLFVHVDSNRPEVPMYVYFQLTDEEVADIVKNKGVWYDQLTFGNPFQPMAILTKNPFTNPIEPFPAPMDENRVPASEWDNTHFKGRWQEEEMNRNSKCINCGKYWNEHFFSSRQCELEPNNG